jgi:hypothetical protein
VTRFSIKFAVGAAGVAVLFSACSSSGSSAAAPTKVPTIGEPGSQVKEYHSTDALAADAAAVVLVSEATATRYEDIAGTKFPVVTMPVLRTLAGDVGAAKTVDVRTVVADADTNALVLSEKGTYLLFLTPFLTKPGEVTGEWVATGGPAGMYLQLADGAFHRLDPDSADLPAQVNVDRLTIPALRTVDEIINQTP